MGFRTGSPSHPSRVNVGILLLLPTILILLFIGIFPLLFAVYTSFHTYYLNRPDLGQPFVGFNNYLTTFANPFFWKTLGTTGKFMLLTLPAEFLLGILVAVIMSKNILGGQVIRVLLITPLTVTPVVIGLIWRLMYNPQFGVINFFLGSFGILPIDWLGSAQVPLYSVAIVDIWQWMPFIMLICLANILAIPTEYFEAAVIDGASKWAIFRYITLPFLAPGLVAVLIIRTADVIRTFDMVYIITRGGPGTTTELVSLYVYRLGFKIFDLGHACAISILLLFATIVISQVYLRLFYREI